MSLFILLCLRLIEQPAMGNEVPPLEDTAGNPASGPVGIVVYSARDGAAAASLVGSQLCGAGLHPQAVADVRGLNFWPASGFVRGTVQSQEARDGARILLDWTGVWGDSLGAPAGGCTVLKTDGEHVTMMTSCSAVLEGHVRVE